MTSMCFVFATGKSWLPVVDEIAVDATHGNRLTEEMILMQSLETVQTKEIAVICHLLVYHHAID